MWSFGQLLIGDLGKEKKKESVIDNELLKVRPSCQSRVRLYSSRAFWWEVEYTFTVLTGQGGGGQEV